MEQKTIGSWLQNAQRQLRGAEIASASIDARVLISHRLGQPPEWIIAHTEHKIEEPMLAVLNNDLARRLDREPLAYIIGSKEFYGHAFFVNKDVLIPRPESESIIEILRDIAAKEEVNTIIDIGTGSGCLAITAKLLFPEVHVTAIDSSQAALRVAKKNARQYHIQIQFRELDIFESLPSMPRTRPYILLANLPYVPEQLITSEEIIHEPAEALFSGNDGLTHYRTFWKQVSNLKNKPDYILAESLQTQHDAMIKLAGTANYKLDKTDILAQQFTLQHSN